MDNLPWVTAFFLGLFGAGHCLGMCGGIAAALSFAVPVTERYKKLLLLLGYNIGRILSYTAFGAAVGAVGHQISSASGMPILRVLSGVLLILMGLYLADWWKGLTYIERLGNIVWRKIQPLSKALMPVKRLDHAVLLGAVWGWLPCGLVYSAATYAAMQSSATHGGAVMLAFGLGTLPAVFLGGLAGQGVKEFLQNKWVRRSFAVLFILYGGWVLYGVTQRGHTDHSQHMMTEQQTEEEHPVNCH